MTSEQQDFYAILGVAPTATGEEIGRAYRSLLRKHHPDTRAPSDREHVDSSNDLQQLLLAYRTLRDPARRAEHDRDRAASLREQASQVPFRPYPARKPDIIAGPVYWRPSPTATPQEC